MKAAPAIDHVGIEVEPVAIGRGRTVLDDVVERPEATTDMVEDPVEDDTHAAAMGLVEELPERIVPTEERIDVEVVVRVVSMVGGRREDRI